MSTSTSVGRGPASGGNENHDGDALHKTLGETVKSEPPAGSTAANGDVIEAPRTEEAVKPLAPGKGGLG